MARIHGEVTIECPIDTVFDHVADRTKEPTYNPRIGESVKLTAGPIGVGTRFRTLSSAGGRPVEGLIDVTEYARPSRLTFRTYLPTADIENTLQFRPAPTGTQVAWNWSVRPVGPARLLSPLIATLGRRRQTANWTTLKRHLEQRPDGPPGR